MNELQEIKNRYKQLKDTYSVGFNADDEKLFNAVEKDLNDLEKLKIGYIEEEYKRYYKQSQYYFNEYTDEVLCGITLSKWNGKYKIVKNKKINIETQEKHYDFVAHYTCKEDIPIKDLLKMNNLLVEAGKEEDGKK